MHRRLEPSATRVEPEGIRIVKPASQMARVGDWRAHLRVNGAKRC